MRELNGSLTPHHNKLLTMLFAMDTFGGTLKGPVDVVVYLCLASLYDNLKPFMPDYSFKRHYLNGGEPPIVERVQQDLDNIAQAGFIAYDSDGYLHVRQFEACTEQLKSMEIAYVCGKFHIPYFYRQMDSEDEKIHFIKWFFTEQPHMRRRRKSFFLPNNLQHKSIPDQLESFFLSLES